jgi:hypothetical protein
MPLAVQEVAETVSSVATAIIAALALWQIRLIRRQFRTTFEDGLTQQYRDIMKDIPVGVWLGDALGEVSAQDRERCRDAIYRYIDLSQDQVFLHAKGRICEATWGEWKSGIESNMRQPAFREVWAEVRQRRPESYGELAALLRQQ